MASYCTNEESGRKLIERFFILQESGIPVPKHIVVSREGVPEGEDPSGFEESEDYVSMNGAPGSIAD